MDLFKSFKNLFNKLVASPVAQFVEQKFDDNDHLPERTPFEKQLVHCFENCSHREEYSAIRVSIVPTQYTGYAYEDRRTGEKGWGFYDIAPVPKTKSLPELLKEYNDCGYTVVMLLDAHGPSLEEQIPGWGHGKMDFPDRFTASPLITINISEEQKFQMAVGESMHEAIGRTAKGERRTMPYYIRGVINGGRSFTP